jgi:ABC-type sugar transport system ATPase subunit
MSSILELKNISFNYDSRGLAQLTDIYLHVDDSEVVSIVGPSGTGKTTLLKIILGNVSPQKGEVFFHNEVLTSANHLNESLLENISFVAQENTLDFGKTVFENISSPITDKMDEVEVTNRVRDLIEIFGLEYKDHKLPADLSAGQRQRVEFAKAIVSRPQLLLLDEPFNNLDQSLKEEVISEVFPIFKERGIAVLFVTHNLEEAFSISDRMVVFAHGKIQQAARPFEVYHHPASAYVAKFSGRVNLMASNVVGKNDEELEIKNVFGSFFLPAHNEIAGKKFVYLGIRPEFVNVVDQSAMSGRIKRIDFRGDKSYLELLCKDGHKIVISTDSTISYRLDQQIRFTFDAERLFLLPI